MKYFSFRNRSKHIEDDECKTCPVNDDYICNDCCKNYSDEEFDSYELEGDDYD